MTGKTFLLQKNVQPEYKILIDLEKMCIKTNANRTKTKAV